MALAYNESQLTSNQQTGLSGTQRVLRHLFLVGERGSDVAEISDAVGIPKHALSTTLSKLMYRGNKVTRISRGRYKILPAGVTAHKKALTQPRISVMPPTPTTPTVEESTSVPIKVVLELEVHIKVRQD